MGVIKNYIDDSEKTFLETTVFAAGIDDLWTSNGTLSLDTTTYLDAEYGSLKLIPSASENFLKYNYYSTTASVPSQYAITLTEDGNDFIESYVWVRATKNCSVFLKTVLSEVVLDATTAEFEFVNPFEQVIGTEGAISVLIGGTDEPKWQLLRAVGVEVPNDGRWSIQLHMRVVFDDLTGASINIARPTAHQGFRVFDNSFLKDALQYIPQIFLENDFGNYQTNEVTFPLTRFLDVTTTTLDDITDLIADFSYVDISEGRDESNPFTLSGLVDPIVCDSRFLYWLAQFRGRPILITYQPSTEGIGWSVFTLNSSLLSGLDPITGLPVGVDVLGGDATNFGGLPAGVEAFARWQVETGYYGHNAGTVNAMREAIKRNLTGTKTVNYTLSTNQINFTTAQSETSGTVIGNVGTSNALIVALIEPARPLGMLVTHTMT